MFKVPQHLSLARGCCAQSISKEERNDLKYEDASSLGTPKERVTQMLEAGTINGLGS